MRKFWQKKYVSKYTGKEIDDAVAKAGTALQNPMTAAGDLIVGGTDGAAGKLAKGTDGKVLKMVSGAPAWADDSQGMVNPMTTAGDVIIGGTDGAPDRLAKGTDGQVLSMVSGAPAWAAASGGSLYWHSIQISGLMASGTVPFVAYIIILNNSNTVITKDNLTDQFSANQNAEFIVVNYHFETNDPGYFLLYFKYGSATACKMYYTTSGGTTYDETLSFSSLTVTDQVSQLL